MKILITGIAGHLGSKLAEYALAQGDEVYGQDDFSCGYCDNVPDGVRQVYNGDLSRGVGAGGAQKFDVVYHLAAYAAECMSPHIRAFNYQNNVVSTAHVVNHCVQTRARLVYTSSAAVYGKPMLFCDDGGKFAEPPFDEDLVCIPHDPYGVAKLACEMDIRIAGEQHRLQYCILRPHNVYGPGQSIWQRYRNVFGIWFSQLFQNQPITIFGDGSQRRAFSYISDVIPCIYRAGTEAKALGETINIGGAKPTSLNEALCEFSNVIGDNTVVCQRLPARHEVKDVWCTTEKSERLLGYREHWLLSVGLKVMLDYAQKAWNKYPERQNVMSVGNGVELFEGMPESWRKELENSSGV
jgi:UDP-glucose 4-epimerase